MAVEVEVKKWGNSLGIVLPKKFVETRDIQAKQKILIEVMKTADLNKFSTLPRKMSGQKFKDMVREGWD